MDVIPGNMPFQNFNVIRLADLPDQFPHPASNFTCQNRLAVFGDPNQMKFQIIKGMYGSIDDNVPNLKFTEVFP